MEDGKQWDYLEILLQTPNSTEAVPQVTSSKKQPLYAVVLASRHQMSSWPWSGERLLQEPAPEPTGTEAADHGGRRELGVFEKESRSSDPWKSQQALQQGE